MLNDWQGAEACFFIKIKKSSSNLIGYQVFLLFALTQHSRDRKLLDNIKEYLDCGKVKYKEKESTSRSTILIFKVVKFANNFEKIIPFFREHEIKGIKYLDFNS